MANAGPGMGRIPSRLLIPYLMAPAGDRSGCFLQAFKAYSCITTMYITCIRDAVHAPGRIIENTWQDASPAQMLQWLLGPCNSPNVYQHEHPALSWQRMHVVLLRETIANFQADFCPQQQRHMRGGSVFGRSDTSYLVSALQSQDGAATAVSIH